MEKRGENDLLKHLSCVADHCMSLLTWTDHQYWHKQSFIFLEAEKVIVWEWMMQILKVPSCQRC